MLPPGHIAAGFLAANLVTAIVPFEFNQSQQQTLVLLGMFFAFAPDLDFFLAFLKTKKFVIDNKVANHRKFISHTPLLWLFFAILLFVFAGNDFGKTAAILLWLCSWTHFVLDSEWGIMWLWPFNTKLVHQKADTDPTPTQLSFVEYWKEFLKKYSTQKTFYFETLIIITALIVALKI